MFEEHEIRPLDLKKENAFFIKEDIKFLKKNIEQYIQVDCPVCNTNNSDTKFSKNGFSYMECGNCTMLYMSPRPSYKLLRNHYKNSQAYKFFNNYIFPASKEKRREKIFAPRVELILSLCSEYKIKTDSLLEIGSGYGIFLEEIINKKIFGHIVGIESSDSLYETSNQKGVEVYKGVFEDYKSDKKFNVIVSFEVLEHIFEPLSLLNKTYNFLEKNGLLVLTFPNYNGFDIATLMSKSDSIDHEHLNYFNEKSITMVLKKIGFNNIQITTPGQMDVNLIRNKIIEGQFKANKFIQDICINRYDELASPLQDFLVENKLSSHMMVVATK